MGAGSPAPGQMLQGETQAPSPPPERVERAFWGRPQLPRAHGSSQWDPILLSCRAHRLPEDLLWLKMLPLLTSPSSPGSTCPCLDVEPYLDTKPLIS